jgi:hypothetical protein
VSGFPKGAFPRDCRGRREKPTDHVRRDLACALRVKRLSGNETQDRDRRPPSNNLARSLLSTNRGAGTLAARSRSKVPQQPRNPVYTGRNSGGGRK